MTSAKLGVVVDTNLFVSAAISSRGSPHALLRAWKAAAFALITSQEQLDELLRAMRRPRIMKYGVTEADIASLARRLASQATLVEPLTSLPLPVRDVKDEHILGIGFAGKADYLVTGDDDLLVLADDLRLGTMKIVTVAEFLEILRESERDGA
jgi:putative PIN family toxin of toxin-antitoxin system